MKKTVQFLPEMKLIGIKTRTSNALEGNLATAQIGKMMQRFFMENLQDKIKNRKNPGSVFSIYTEYESDENGPYTYFLGEEVSSFDTQESEMETLVIPPQKYMKFTSPPGKIPTIVIDLWQNIWKMKAADFEGKRVYIADFEIYDERVQDPDHAVVDIYVGIEEDSSSHS